MVMFMNMNYNERNLAVYSMLCSSVFTSDTHQRGEDFIRPMESETYN